MPSFSDLLQSIQGRSGLVFTCRVHNLPEETFQVTEFTLNEALSSLFTLSVSVVSPLPALSFTDHLGLA
ncbi:hypothetical protein, partial [Morganella psychrotolerans]|uniref:hypothetical protein n=1 Tax=Morganella psychrotolerans TaxID=368603 RepID=UPI0012E77ECD